MVKKASQREFHSEPLRNLCNQLSAHQRMAAQAEKIIVSTYSIHSEQSNQETRQPLLNFRLRRCEGIVAQLVLRGRLRKRGPIHFAMRGCRYTRKFYKCRRHHVVRQTATEKRAQFGGIWVDVRCGDDICGKTRLSRVARISRDVARTDCWMPVQGRSNFARFNAISADLDLFIDPSHKFNLAVR